MHPFIQPNPEVFALSGPGLDARGFQRVAETQAEPGQGLHFTVEWRGGVPADLEVEHHPISEARRDRGDVVDFTLRITPSAPVPQGAYLVLSIPCRAGVQAEAGFATMASMSLRLRRPDTVAVGHFGIANGPHFLCTHAMQPGPVAYGVLGWRLPESLAEPNLLLHLHLRPFEGPIEVRVGRVFFGPDYDPYAFNPYLERQRAVAGPPDLGHVAEARSEFLRAARAVMEQYDIRGGQSFIHPYVVYREGDPAFPLLIGNLNSVQWYATRLPHGGDFYKRERYVRPGDVALDCGAHAGEIATIFALAAGPEGRVIAIDPFPQNRLQVEAQARLNGLSQLVALEAGVGSARATVPTPLHTQQTVGGVTDDDPRSIFPLKILPIDEFADERVSFLKLDVEGAEVEALRGGQRLLARRRPRIYIEVHPTMLPQFGTTPEELFSLIARHRYRIECVVHGGKPGWQPYEPGIEAQFYDKVGGLVRASPEPA